MLCLAKAARYMVLPVVLNSMLRAANMFILGAMTQVPTSQTFASESKEAACTSYASCHER
ncbi:hypothetical protein OOOCML_33340 (plasmid) [Cupriavidus necator H16]